MGKEIILYTDEDINWDALDNYDHVAAMDEEIKKLKAAKSRQESYKNYRINYLVDGKYHCSHVLVESYEEAKRLAYNAVDSDEHCVILGVEEI